MADTPETPPETPVRHLKSVPKRRGTTAIDVVKPLRRWWRAQHIDDLPENTTLPQAMWDVGIMSFGWIAKRLSDPKTPKRVKDQMAMVMAPKLAVQVQGRGLPADPGTPSPTREVLDVYRGDGTQEG